MKKHALLSLLFLWAAGHWLPAVAEGVDDIVNYRQYSPEFASSGQPAREQLQLLKDAGFERIIYVAYSDHQNSLANEDRLVKDLGMQFVHIPVAWDAPTVEDFGLIAAALRQAPDARTLLHCQVNYRASAFGFLYRVLYEDVPIARAKADMNSVWTPNETWRDLIFEVLQAEGISPDCAGCDWTAAEN
jgi:protein tyrosine phosphatase (PTP) superfamily phosphohydrolase (DUF442 family)